MARQGLNCCDLYNGNWLAFTGEDRVKIVQHVSDIPLEENHG